MQEENKKRRNEGALGLYKLHKEQGCEVKDCAQSC